MIAITNLFKKNVTYVHISKRDLWSVDYTIAKVAHPLLIEFRKNPCGHPAEMTSEEWDGILDKMIRSMNSLVDQSFYDSVDDEFQEGFELFGKYFTHLWT